MPASGFPRITGQCQPPQIRILFSPILLNSHLLCSSSPFLVVNLTTVWLSLFLWSSFCCFPSLLHAFLLKSQCISSFVFPQSNVFSSGILNLASPPKLHRAADHISLKPHQFFSLSWLLRLPAIQFIRSPSPDNIRLRCLFCNTDQWWMAMCVHTLCVLRCCLFQGKMHEAESTGNCTEPVKTTVLYLPHNCMHTLLMCPDTHTMHVSI